jgi:hypothetical protein
MHKFYLGFHVDKFHLKQTNKKELEHLWILIHDIIILLEKWQKRQASI